MDRAEERAGADRRIRTVHSGRWLHFRIAETRDGRPGWEYVDREGQQPAALMIARLQPSGDLVLVRQDRPPIGRPTIEFPAGLVDPGETVAAAAVRELREETGYRGSVLGVSPELASSPGVTSERAYLVEMEILEAGEGNATPQAQPDPGEQIEVLRVPMTEALDLLQRLADRGEVIDSRVWAWLAARTPRGRESEQGECG